MSSLIALAPSVNFEALSSQAIALPPHHPIFSVSAGQLICYPRLLIGLCLDCWIHVCTYASWKQHAVKCIGTLHSYLEYDPAGGGQVGQPTPNSVILASSPNRLYRNTTISYHTITFRSHKKDMSPLRQHLSCSDGTHSIFHLPSIPYRRGFTNTTLFPGP